MIGASVFSGLLGVSQAATGSLVAAVWQGLLLATAVWVGLRMLPKTPAGVRFAIWFAVFGVVAALPVVALWHGATGVAGGHGAWLTVDSRWCVGIAAIWVAASLVRAATLVVAAFRVRELWKRAEAVEIVAQAELVPQTHISDARCGAPAVEAIHSGRRAEVCVSDEVDRPSVIGFFAPKILIPRWLLEKLTAEEMRQICLHEAGHLRRADDWLNLVQKVALVVFPLNPVLAWVERRLCFERELACDERVVRATGAPKAYAACLAGLAEYRMGRRGVALSIGALGRESELGRRVGRILRGGEGMRPMQARLVMGGAVLGLMAGAVGLARCPQVVGFSEVQGSGIRDQGSVRQGVGNREQGVGSGVGGGYRADAVVFRPDTGLHGNAGDIGRGLNVPQGSVVARTHVSESRPFGKLRAGYAAPAAVPVRAVVVKGSERGVVGQWVVVTAWGSAGARVVMTATEIPAVERGDAPRVVTDYEAGEAAHDPQVHPYAAVPVRDGWLVIQL